MSLPLFVENNRFPFTGCREGYFVTMEQPMQKVNVLYFIRTERCTRCTCYTLEMSADYFRISVALNDS